MGSFVSVHKDSEALFRFRLGSGGSSRRRKLFVGPMRAAKEDEKGGGNPVGGFQYDSKPVDYSGFNCASFVSGSKDETFFDSRAWLDSDCEDDFFSVNGDFIPSGNSTPNHQMSTPRTPTLSKTFIIDAPPGEPSPRKKFAEFLLDTEPDEEASKEQAVNSKADGKIGVNGHSESPTQAKTSGRSSEGRTPNGSTTNGKHKTSKTMHCCLPGVVPTFSVQDRKKHRLSPQLQNRGS